MGDGPEKYHDAVLHDDFLRRWVPRLDRQVVVLNKIDRLSPESAQGIRRDLERELGAEGAVGARRRPPVLLVAAAPAGYAYANTAGPDLTELRAWLSEAVEAKAVVTARLAASIRTAIASLAADAGIRIDTRPSPILDGPSRRAAIDRATDGAAARRRSPRSRASGRGRDASQGEGAWSGRSDLSRREFYRYSGRELGGRPRRLPQPLA